MSLVGQFLKSASSKLSLSAGTINLNKKIKEALSNDNWGCATTILSDISIAANDVVQLPHILKSITEALNERNAKWRRIFKAVTLIDYIVRNGSEKVIEEFRQPVFLFRYRYLTDLQFSEKGVDKTQGLRIKAKDLLDLINNTERLTEERQKAADFREKFVGIDAAGTQMSSLHSAPGLAAEDNWKTSQWKLDTQPQGISLQVNAQEEARRQQQRNKARSQRIKNLELKQSSAIRRRRRTSEPPTSSSDSASSSSEEGSSSPPRSRDSSKPGLSKSPSRHETVPKDLFDIVDSHQSSHGSTDWDAFQSAPTFRPGGYPSNKQSPYGSSEWDPFKSASPNDRYLPNTLTQQQSQMQTHIPPRQSQIHTRIPPQQSQVQTRIPPNTQSQYDPNHQFHPQYNTGPRGYFPGPQSGFESQRPQYPQYPSRYSSPRFDNSFPNRMGHPPQPYRGQGMGQQYTHAPGNMNYRSQSRPMHSAVPQASPQFNPFSRS